MKLSISKPLLITLALTGLISLTACSKSNANAEPQSRLTAAGLPTQNSSPFADVEKRMQDLDTRMDSIFANAFRNVGNWFDKSMVASSVDLREQNGNYVTHVYVPGGNTDKADVKIENGALHIVMNDERTINGNTEPEHYEQIINFPKPVQSDKMQDTTKERFDRNHCTETNGQHSRSRVGASGDSGALSSVRQFCLGKYDVRQVRSDPKSDEPSAAGRLP